MFSTRTPPELGENALARAVAARRAAGLPLCDLTRSNPTSAGLELDREAIAEALAAGARAEYAPTPRGLVSARRAVAGELARRGLALDPDHVVLCASTSEAYALLFKLLCDPGDELLLPAPSYPLFAHLAAAEGVAARHYPLHPSRGFGLDVDRVDAHLGERTRAVVVVSPNNPTGSIVDRAAGRELAELAAARELAIVSDEVFADYPLGASAPPSMLELGGALRFCLGGLSKSCGMPQLKLSWIAVAGPPEQRDEALARLDVLADAFLSVSTPVQVALPGLLRAGALARARIADRLRASLARLREVVAAVPGARLQEPNGGWYASIELDGVGDDEALALRLVERGVLVHPGYLFDFSRGAWVVVSLLSPPGDIERLSILGALS